MVKKRFFWNECELYGTSYATFKVEKWVGRNNIKFLLRPYFLTKKKEFSNFFLKVKKTTL